MVHEIFTQGKNFQKVNNFMWNFKVSCCNCSHHIPPTPNFFLGVMVSSSRPKGLRSYSVSFTNFLDIAEVSGGVRERGDIVNVLFQWRQSLKAGYCWVVIFFIEMANMDKMLKHIYAVKCYNPPANPRSILNNSIKFYASLTFYRWIGQLIRLFIIFKFVLFFYSWTIPRVAGGWRPSTT